MYGESLAAWAGWTDNLFMAESPEDRASYFWGQWIKDKFLETRHSPDRIGLSDNDLLRISLCAVMKTQAAPKMSEGFIPGLNFDVFPCGKCTEPQSVQDRKVRRVLEWRRPGPSGPEYRYTIEYEHGWVW